MKKAVYVVLMIFVSGCVSHKQDQKIPLPPPPVPAAPAYSAKPLEPALRAQAIKELLTDVGSEDPFLRSNSIEALSDVDPSDAAVPILKGLTDPASPVRFSAAVSAGQLKLVEAYDPLRAMADDPDLRVQAGVRFALHRLGDTRLSHDLEKLAAAPDPSVRGTTAMVLGLLKEPSATNILLTLLADPASTVRIQAAEALWRLGNERGLTDLVAFSISRYPDEQIIALRAIAAPGDQRVTQHVRGDLKSDYIEVSLTAARSLGVLGSDEGWNIAVPVVQSKDPRQRALAALAMGAIGRSDLQDYLATLLKDQEQSVRISAATAILQLQSPTQYLSAQANR